jgi:hypothetical protein
MYSVMLLGRAFLGVIVLQRFALELMVFDN